MSFSLIVPAASETKEQSQLPLVFSLDKEGISYCIRAIMGLNLSSFDNIFFTILRKHNELFCISELLNIQFKRLNITNAKVVILDRPTNNQAETIYETIKQCGIQGSVFIKDADCYFSGEIYPQNGVAIFPLEKLQLVNPQHKSYVSVDDMFYITNIIEKKIISHYFCAGGYCFEDSSALCDEFLKYYGQSELFLSHIIYSMMLNHNIFRPFIVNNYIDFEI